MTLFAHNVIACGDTSAQQSAESSSVLCHSRSWVLTQPRFNVAVHNDISSPIPIPARPDVGRSWILFHPGSNVALFNNVQSAIPIFGVLFGDRLLRRSGVLPEPLNIVLPSNSLLSLVPVSKFLQVSRARPSPTCNCVTGYYQVPTAVLISPYIAPLKI